MNEKYDALAALLDRFGWLGDSLLYAISLDGSLRYDIRATLLFRVIDHHDGRSDKTLKLVLTDVTEFKLEQIPGLAAFETSQGARIARDDGRLFLDLSGSDGITNADAMPAEWVPRPLPRHVAAADIRKRGLYLDFKDFTSEILQGTAVENTYFGIAREQDLDIREETSDDIEAIRAITKAAFADKPYSDQTEAEVIDRLRAADAIQLSLVAVSDGVVIGNVVFSNVAIDEMAGWVGLGPVSVAPDLQRRGAGTALINAGLDRMRAEGAAGCVLVGDPGYYQRFGFKRVAGLRYEGVPDEYVLALPFTGVLPNGALVFHPAFSN